MSEPILSLRELSVSVETREGPRALVDRVSFDLEPGEILGLVGESGSGKSVTCRALIRLLPSSSLSVTGGSILSRGEEVLTMDDRRLRRLRGGTIGMIFQNPTSHLDPVMTIGDQIMESVRFHRSVGKKDARARAIEVLTQVGIPDPVHRLTNFPHEFSGGMRQRAMIAVALACDPEVLIADEPTTALDVTVQAQILRLLMDLRDRDGLSIILITHDLGIVAQSCDGVAVMYGGRICERGPMRTILGDAKHPYTAGLIACQPGEAPKGQPVRTIPGQPPTVGAMPSGCRFHPRCANARAACSETQPAMVALAPDHDLACHYPLGASEGGPRA